MLKKDAKITFNLTDLFKWSGKKGCAREKSSFHCSCSIILLISGVSLSAMCQKYRAIEEAGVELRILKQHLVEVEYIFQSDYLPHISDINIISINYNFKF